MKRTNSDLLPDKRQRTQSYEGTAVETWIAVGRCSLTLGLVAAAVKSFEYAVGHDRGDAQALVGWAHALRLHDVELGQVYGSQVAAETLHAGVEQQPSLGKDKEVFREMGECYLAMGALGPAQHATQTAIQLDAGDASLWLLNGRILVKMGELKDATKSLTYCLSLLPQSLSQFGADHIEIARTAHTQLAAIATLEDDIEFSMAELIATLSLPAPPLARIDENIVLWCALAVTKEKANDIPGGLQVCDTAESLLGGSARIFMTRVYLLLADAGGDRSGRAQQAIELLQKIIANEPGAGEKQASDDGDFLPWYLLGKAYSLLTSYRLAYDAYQVALRRAANHPIAWLAVGQLYLHLNQLPDALAAYSQALRLQVDELYPGTATAWDGLSCIYERSDDQLVDAADACTRAAASFKLNGSAASAAFFENRSTQLKLASKKEAPVPTLRDASGVPNYLLQDFVSLLPEERIAMVKRYLQPSPYPAHTSTQSNEKTPHTLKPHDKSPGPRHHHMSPINQAPTIAVVQGTSPQATQPPPQQLPQQLSQQLQQQLPQQPPQQPPQHPASQHYLLHQNIGTHEGSPRKNLPPQIWSPQHQRSQRPHTPHQLPPQIPDQQMHPPPQYYYHSQANPIPNVQPIVPNQHIQRSPIGHPQMIRNGPQFPMGPNPAPRPSPGPNTLGPPPQGYPYGQYRPMHGSVLYGSQPNHWGK